MRNKSDKNQIIIIILTIIIFLEFVGIVILKMSFTQEEKIIYELAYQKQNDFKNPSTVKITDAVIYDGKYIVLQMGGNNSFGAFVKDTYYIKDNTLYNKDNSYKVCKEIIEKCFECEKNEKSKIVKLSEDSINKINSKLEKRYKW